ncbi:MAG TPA: GspH/FimT family pseudopilin [Povalibacter sp.]|jgi:prepilin-type N-terminal cleavage/methylation domain-containing protein|nr:GspH/FimT family pseudopilin [Povalibacter sp.]
MRTPAIPLRRHRGFTLVELVTSLVILGLLAAYAAPRFFDNQPFQARGYADELAQALRHARKVAINSECPVHVVITAVGYSLAQQANSNCTGAWTTAVRSADGSVVSGIAPPGVALAPAAVIAFDRTGSPATATDLSVDTFTISIAGNGRIAVTP